MDCGSVQRVNMAPEVSLQLISDARTREEHILGLGPSRCLPLGKLLVPPASWLRFQLGEPLQQNAQQSIHLPQLGTSPPISFQKYWPFIFLLLWLLIHDCPYILSPAKSSRVQTWEIVWAA